MPLRNEPGGKTADVAGSLELLKKYAPVYYETLYGEAEKPNDPDGGRPPATGPGDSGGAGWDGVDFESYLGLFGLPADVLREITAIFKGDDDPQRAAQRAIAYVRGTSWYSQTYPGIQEAIAKGTVTNERDYRAKLNNFNQVFRQWTNQDIGLDQYAQYLKEGVDADTVGRRFAGDAFITANRGDIQYLSGNFGDGVLGQDDLQAYGRNQAGLGSARGVNIQTLLEKAQTRAQRVFEGTLATFNGGVQGELQKKQQLADIGR